MLHDTTEFTYQRENPEAIGLTYRVNSGRDKAGRFRVHTVSGILMHSSLVVTLEGVPLGLAAIKFWTRKRFKGTAALKKKVNPTRIPVERRRASSGWRTYGMQQRLPTIRRDASISGTARATSMSCSRSPRSWERSSWCEPA